MSELAVWLINRGRYPDVSMRSMRVRHAQLLARQQDEIWQRPPSDRCGRDLYNEIVRPLPAQLAGASRLVVVPDLDVSGRRVCRAL